MCSSLLLANIAVVQSSYSSVLTENHPTYYRVGTASESRNYFEAIKINVDTAGYYDLISDSNMNPCGYLYNHSFDLVFPDVNLVYSDYLEDGNDQFMLSVVLQTMSDYILVTTTTRPLVTGSYSILSTGPDSVNFSPTNMTREQQNYL